MAIKWKSNKRTFLPAVAISVAASLVFMSFFPFFTRKAKENYSDPLMDQDFLENLMSINYVQYKYLREKVDQKQYDYCDLFLKFDTTTYEDNYDYQESVVDLRSQELASRLHDFFCGSFDTYERLLYAYGEQMDYYVEDLTTGATLSNCGSNLAAEVDSGKTETQELSGLEDQTAAAKDSPAYIYYVSLEYDNAGNVHNIRVRSQDNAKVLLSRVQSAGHERLVELPQTDAYTYEPGGQSASYYIYGENEDIYASIQVSLTAPSNMRVIYGLTQQQYASLNPSNSEISLGYTYYHYGSGVSNAYILMLGICALIGFWWSRKTGGGKSRIYAEIYLLASIIPMSFSSAVINYVYEYENNLFLRNIRAGIGNNGRILFLRVDSLGIFLFMAALFFCAYLIGWGLSDIRRGNLRERSFLCKYWNRICSKIKELSLRFYREVVSYDIGTDANKIIIKVLAVNFVILMVICCFWFAGIPGLIIYSVIVYFLLKRYVMDIQEKYRKLLGATSAIAQGNLDTALSEDFGIFESYKSELRQIQVDFKRAVEDEVKSQRMKSELITNVSHDLKTPLTAIITYIDLLKEPGVTDEMREEYLNILQKKANRLKILIGDLFELSKASSKTVTLQIIDVDICNLLRQVYLEQEDRIEAAKLDFKFNLPQEKVLLPLDSEKTYRIFDNLYTNIIKYAMSGTRVYINLKQEADQVEIELKNISASELTMDPNELTERFVRGDGSRNTEGSGLGLAIAKSFVELQGGSMRISFDGDLYKCILCFRRKGASQGGANTHSDSADRDATQRKRGSYKAGSQTAERSPSYYGQPQNSYGNGAYGNSAYGNGFYGNGFYGNNSSEGNFRRNHSFQGNYPSGGQPYRSSPLYGDPSMPECPSPNPFMQNQAGFSMYGTVGPMGVTGNPDESVSGQNSRRARREEKKRQRQERKAGKRKSE